MSLFICAKCGCVENTATSDYWAVVHNLFPIEYDESLKGYEGKPLCSECGRIVFDEDGNNARMVPGKWHGRFPKNPATEDERLHAGANGIITFKNK